MNVRKIIHDLYQQHKVRTPAEFWAAGGCLAFPGMVAEAITGIDPTAAARAQIKTEADAKRLMVENGCRSMAEAVGDTYAEIPGAMARAGDWATVANADGSDGLGVVMGAQILVETPKGMGTVALTRAVKAWRVA